MNITDRSRILAYQTCNRFRFLLYHVLGTGITQLRENLALSVGSAVHKGIELILQSRIEDEEVKEIDTIVSSYYPNLDSMSKELLVSCAIRYATSEFSALIHKSELDLEPDEDHLFVLQEQKALIEALIWVWYFVQYPKLVSEYEVLYVEKEIEWPLSQHNPIRMKCVNCDKEVQLMFAAIDNIKGRCGKCKGELKPSKWQDEILFLSRPDAILRDKSTGGLVVYSLKTASSWTETNDKQAKYDDQGISELIAVEKFMSGQCNKCKGVGTTLQYTDVSKSDMRDYTCRECKGSGIINEKVEAIKMEYLLKGSRKKMKDYNSDEYVKMQSSFLVHPYMRDGIIEEYALNFVGRPPKGWRRVNIWEEMTIKEWIEYLVENHYEELEKQIVTPYPYNRNEEDIENWLEQNTCQEEFIIDSIRALQILEPNLVGPRESSNPLYKRLLNRTFPQRRKECFQYGGFCQFVDHCWEGVKVTSQEFKPRVPNHPRELVELKGLNNE